MRKRFLSILLTLCMVLCLAPTAAFAADAPSGTPLTQEMIEQNKTSGGIQLPAGSYYLTGDIRLEGDNYSALPLYIPDNAEVTLDLNGHVLDLQRGCIRVAGKLTLTDSNTGNRTHKFCVEDSGLWVLDEENGTQPVNGGAITGGGRKGLPGGGVFVKGSDGKFIDGSFNMKGSSIVGCTALQAGGGVYNDGTFTMLDGSISDCMANDVPNAAHVDGTFTNDANIGSAVLTGINAGQAGTKDDPILIASPAGLKDFRDRVNGTGKYTTANPTLCAKLTCDIVLNPGTFAEDGSYTENGAAAPPTQWTPIGDNTNHYKGTFDGQGNTVKGLYVNVTANGDGAYVGLFGYAENATIKNVTADGYVSLSGTSDYETCIGGIAGAGSVPVSSCYNTGTAALRVRRHLPPATRWATPAARPPARTRLSVADATRRMML